MIIKETLINGTIHLYNLISYDKNSMKLGEYSDTFDVRSKFDLRSNRESHMKRSIKYKISKALCCHVELNRCALRIKRSWDEIDALLNCKCKCPKNCDSHKRKW